MDQSKIGSFISELRKSKKLTQEQFAEIIGVTQKSVSRWETGKNMPDISLLQPIAEELDVSVTELLNGEKSTVPIEENTTKAISQLIDYSSNTRKEQIFSLKDTNFITWVFFILSAVLLIISAFINLRTIPLVVVGIILLIVVIRFLFGRCPGCRKLMPFTMKTPQRCPFCGMDLAPAERK
ncbi:MAG: helix-turn-helix transcriptional regulator [Oscillospiraceae bacterium]|nr:helix-turn-helix transcriptional regulator [Oscillospiraceae bacterium]